VLDPEPTVTLEAIRDRISTRIVEHFSGHKLTALVADVLAALGWVCRVSPPGADGGVDILAGRGPLGLDSPTLVVEVKSELKAVGAPVVRGLSGAVTSNAADQGLLVAWGGVTDPARNEFAQQRTRIAIWDASDLLEKIFEVYPQLSDETRVSLPLKMAWVLDDENDLGA
jgi:restriction system protein